MVKFTINGIPIAVQPLFWVVAVFLGFDVFSGAELVLWVGIVFVSILIHELGHAFTAQAFGRDPTVLLHGFGGLTSWAAVPELSPTRRILVTLAGPFSGFALAGVAWMILEFGGLDDGGRTIPWLAAVVTMRVNLLWGVFNLIPIRGLDGGQTVAGVLALVWPKRAVVVSEVIFITFGVGAAVFGLLQGFYLLAFFALLLTFGGMFGSRRSEVSPPPGGTAGRPAPAEPEPTRDAVAHPRRAEPDRDDEPPLLGI